MQLFPRPAWGFVSLIAIAVLSGCASDDALRMRRLQAEATQLRAQAADPDIGLRMEQQALHLYPDIVTQMDRLRAEHRVIQAPRVTRATTPKYPFTHRMRDVQGAVWVAFVLSPQGVPTRITVLSGESSLADPAFAKSATDAVSHWRFLPASVDGEPISCIQCVPVVFQLR